MRNTKIFFALVVILIFEGCKKESFNSDPKPVITIESITPNSVKQFEDSVTITFTYKDGDGDLGEINADIRTLEIQDIRLTKPDYYYIPPLAPLDAKISITGKLKVQLRNLFLLGSGSSETTHFEIKVKDRAGNSSNIAISPDITIVK